MFDRFSSTQRIFIRACLGICIFVTPACGTTTVNAPVPLRQTCTPSNPQANPYHSHEPSQRIRDIFLSRSTISIGKARQDALVQLGQNLDHWSDKVDIALDDYHMVRIVVTYLDPILIQYIVLNHVLNYSDGFVDDAVFSTTLTETMDRLKRRDEILFIVTVTSPFYREQAYNDNVLTVRIPIEQMALINSSDMRVTPTHEDHILDENIDITHGPVSGIVGYPLAIMEREQCVWILDYWTNNLTLEVPSITLGNTTFGAQFWNIPYLPLVMEMNNPQIPTIDPNYEWNPVRILATPPTPHWEPNAQVDNTDWTIYWQDMGRYIWSLVITESHH